MAAVLVDIVMRMLAQQNVWLPVSQVSGPVHLGAR